MEIMSLRGLTDGWGYLMVVLLVRRLRSAWHKAQDGLDESREDAWQGCSGQLISGKVPVLLEVDGVDNRWGWRGGEQRGCCLLSAEAQ